MLLKQQDLCYSSPASSASWPHCPVVHEGPREILLGNRELLIGIVIFLHQSDVIHLGLASRLAAVPLGLVPHEGFSQRQPLLLLPHVRVPSQNSSRFPFQRVDWQQVRSLDISSTSLVWIKMHAIATGRAFALEAPVDFRLTRLQRICIGPANRKKGHNAGPEGDAGPRPSLTGAPVDLHVQVLVRCVLSSAARSLNSIWVHVPPEVNCESAVTALEPPRQPLTHLGFVPDAGLWNVGSDLPSWPLSSRWLAPVIINSRASLRRIQLSGVVLSSTTWLNGSSPASENFVDAAVQAMAKLEVLESLSLVLQYPDGRGSTVEPMSLFRLRKAHPNHVYLCQARKGNFGNLLRSACLGPLAAASPLDLPFGSRLTLGAARDEEHNLETDRALAHYSRIQQWSGRSVYISEMSVFLPSENGSGVGGDIIARPRIPSSLLLPKWSELPQPTQQLWDEVICLAVKRIHDKVKTRAQKSFAPVTTELRRAIARQY
ncbi:hypothetical protein FOZ60_007460 [Perkinsus olseni]|uniref:Uncharacterized protein n=1 Tax=Perkinsus olseni TaxID=32597 RepID=A0A7J6PML1_PEROL|nr:hypothetical protein FOZ60_007460 [Perkinsus olseni]